MVEVIIHCGTTEEVLIIVHRTVGDIFITTTKLNDYKWCPLFIGLRTINISKSNNS